VCARERERDLCCIQDRLTPFSTIQEAATSSVSSGPFIGCRKRESTCVYLLYLFLDLFHLARLSVVEKGNPLVCIYFISSWSKKNSAP
jgi:hypothetical protein